MAGMCCGVVGEGESPASSRPSRRRNLDLLSFKYIADMASGTSRKRRQADLCKNNDFESCDDSSDDKSKKNKKESKVSDSEDKSSTEGNSEDGEFPKFGVTSVCGRRRDMEDSVSVKPSFSSQEPFHYFGVFDGHGCSHVSIFFLLFSVTDGGSVNFPATYGVNFLFLFLTGCNYV
jgi:protein phosphatase 2C